VHDLFRPDPFARNPLFLDLISERLERHWRRANIVAPVERLDRPVMAFPGQSVAKLGAEVASTRSTRFQQGELARFLDEIHHQCHRNPGSSGQH
jgi:hypothetical protein